ncbi:MAG: hypothetical protein A3G18_06855 [Rhodospirillales bacterium RIFCSPLOWO2_12_FULL_58_28]|nr:MAG: hypothetical protein A3H92_11420 [Rhodospirillales bacterium RIFCSPLOWO2_02_FULL_58_16]OHC77440.1 MAG: hypothetical protein A3G18_06855 [Rhodospirillales bacterium RIFCSPLOWO2_12_FULL_58_28]
MVIESLTALLVLITAIYAYLTYRMAKASEASMEAVRDQSEAMLRPYITVAPFIRPHTPFLYLRVKNTGRMGARNLHLTLDRDFFQYGEKDGADKNLRSKSAFSTPIDCFPPGAELIFALGPGWVLFGKSAQPDVSPTQFNVTATYEFLGKKAEEVNRVDLRPYIGSEGELDPVVEELERIRKVMEKKK